MQATRGLLAGYKIIFMYVYLIMQILNIIKKIIESF